MRRLIDDTDTAADSVAKVFLYDTQIDFDSGEHLTVMIIAAVLLFIFLVGMPIAIAVFSRRLLSQDRLRDRKTKSAFGGLYDSFRDRHVNFEAYSLIRRGLAVVAVVQLRKTPVFQAFVQIFLSVVYLQRISSSKSLIVVFISLHGRWNLEFFYHMPDSER